MSLFPCGFAPPATSSLNFGAARGAVSTVALSTIGGGNLCIRAHNRTHLIVDVVGVWVPTPGSAAPTPSEPSPDRDPSLPADPDEPGEDGDAGAADAGAMGAVDAGPTGSDAGEGGLDGGLEGGCSVIAIRPDAPGAGLGFLLVLGALRWRRRRRD